MATVTELQKVHNREVHLPGGKLVSSNLQEGFDGGTPM